MAVNILRDAQSKKALQTVVDRHGTSPLMLALIDDDDAWNKKYLQWGIENALKYLTNGENKTVFTAALGYEWVITDMLDVDKANIGVIKIQNEAIREYVRPFLTMCTLIVNKTGQIPDYFGRVHSTKGECLVDEGYKILEPSFDGHAWLYVRHKQADSSINKAHVEPVELSVEQLAETFGVNAVLVKQYQTESVKYEYAQKRILKSEDKANLSVRFEEFLGIEDENFSVEYLDGKLIFKINNTLECFPYRLIGYNESSKEYFLKELIISSEPIVLGEWAQDEVMQMKFKLQSKGQAGERAYVDLIKYEKMKERVRKVNAKAIEDAP